MRDGRTRSGGLAALSVLVLTAALVIPDTTPAFGAGVTTTRVSVDSSGAQAGSPLDDIDLTAPSQNPALSADGRFVAFWSLAPNLVDGDTNNQSDVFVHDRQTGATTRVSVDSGGAQGNGGSNRSAISADGRYVAFTSGATNLVAGDTNGSPDVFVHDRQTGATTLVNVDSGGVQGNGLNFSSAISADGRYVAFSSTATNLVAGDTNGFDVFVHDRQTGTTTRESLTTSGDPVAGFSPSISADGRFVTFLSNSPDVVPATNCRTDPSTNVITDCDTSLFLRDRQAGTTTLVSVGQQLGWSIQYSAISADGRFVAFAAALTLPVQQAYVYERATGAISMVGVDSAGVPGNFGAGEVAISADGRFVAMVSGSTNLVADDTNNQNDAFVHDRQTGTTTRVNVSTAGAQAVSPAMHVAISGDGSLIAYASFAANLVAGDTNASVDVFVSTINPPADTSPPVITPQVTGTLGTGGWYTSNIGVAWNVADPESTLTSTGGCGPATVTADTTGQTFTCSATSAGGTASQSVTVKRDATKPTVTVGGAGTYPVTGTVTVTCSAADATSGVASNTCATIAGTKPAWQYAAGTNARTASATDRAGNTQSATTSVVVTASASGVCTLTKTFVQGSPKYVALSATAKAVTNALLTVFCKDLDRLVSKLTTAQKASVISAYKTAVGSLVSSSWVTADQGAALKRWADAV